VIFLLDTNACIRLLNGTPPALIQRLRQHDPSEVGLCPVVKAELVFGAYRSARAAENLRLLKRFFRPFLSIPFDDRCVESYGLIRRDLESRGTPIGANDLLIAATAKAHDLILVTHNVREFARVPGLEIEDWEVPEI